MIVCGNRARHAEVTVQPLAQLRSVLQQEEEGEDRERQAERERRDPADPFREAGPQRVEGVCRARRRALVRARRGVVVDAEALHPALHLVDALRGAPTRSCRPRPRCRRGRGGRSGRRAREQEHGDQCTERARHAVPLEQRDERRRDRCHDAAAEDGHDDRRRDARGPTSARGGAGPRRRGTTRPGRGRAASAATRTPRTPRAVAPGRARRRNARCGSAGEARRRRASSSLLGWCSDTRGIFIRCLGSLLARSQGFHRVHQGCRCLLQRLRPAAGGASR